MCVTPWVPFPVRRRDMGLSESFLPALVWFCLLSFDMGSHCVARLARTHDVPPALASQVLGLRHGLCAPPYCGFEIYVKEGRTPQICSLGVCTGTEPSPRAEMIQGWIWTMNQSDILKHSYPYHQVFQKPKFRISKVTKIEF